MGSDRDYGVACLRGLAPPGFSFRIRIAAAFPEHIQKAPFIRHATHPILTFSPPKNYMVRRKREITRSTPSTHMVRKKNRIAEKGGPRKVWRSWERPDDFALLSHPQKEKLRSAVEDRGIAFSDLDSVRLFIRQTHSWRSEIAGCGGVKSFVPIMDFLREKEIIQIRRHPRIIKRLLDSFPSDDRRLERSFWAFALVENGATFGEIAEKSGTTRDSVFMQYCHQLNVWTNILGEDPTFGRVREYLRTNTAEDFLNHFKCSVRTPRGTLNFASRLGWVAQQD